MTFDQVCSLPSFFSASGKDHPPEEHAEETCIGSYLDDSDMEQFVGFLSLQDVHTKQVYWTGCEFVVCFFNIRLSICNIQHLRFASEARPKGSPKAPSPVAVAAPVAAAPVAAAPVAEAPVAGAPVATEA